MEEHALLTEDLDVGCYVMSLWRSQFWKFFWWGPCCASQSALGCGKLLYSRGRCFASREDLHTAFMTTTHSCWSGRVERSKKPKAEMPQSVKDSPQHVPDIGTMLRSAGVGAFGGRIGSGVGLRMPESDHDLLRLSSQTVRIFFGDALCGALVITFFERVIKDCYTLCQLKAFEPEFPEIAAKTFEGTAEISGSAGGQGTLPGSTHPSTPSFLGTLTLTFQRHVKMIQCSAGAQSEACPTCRRGSWMNLWGCMFSSRRSCSAWSWSGSLNHNNASTTFARWSATRFLVVWFSRLGSAADAEPFVWLFLRIVFDSLPCISLDQSAICTLKMNSDGFPLPVPHKCVRFIEVSSSLSTGVARSPRCSRWLSLSLILSLCLCVYIYML